MPDCPREYALLRWKTGELPPAEVEQLEHHLTDCAQCREALEELEANRAAFQPNRQRNLQQVLGRLDQQAPAKQTRPRGWWSRGRLVGLSAALGTAAAAVVVLVVTRTDPSPAGYKGALGVQIVARRGGEQFFVEPGGAVQAGDALRFVVTTGRAGHLTVFSIDGRGTLSAFYPRGPGPTPLRLDRPGRHALAGSIVLDDAPGPERLYFVFSERIYDREAIQRRVARQPARGRVTAASIGLEGQLQLFVLSKER
jgi:hypothetical protein